MANNLPLEKKSLILSLLTEGQSVRSTSRIADVSPVERQNLTIRMQMRRFTRLTNAFSKKLQHHEAAIALHFFAYNFVRIHKTLRVTPAMEAMVTNRLWSFMDLLNWGVAVADQKAA